MTLMKISRSGEAILTPPQLPAHLSGVYHLKPIVGKPKDEDVKAIHAVIRAMNAVAHIPTFYNPDLALQLSQHLFSAQMAVYQANYTMSLLPGNKSVYTPPTLPSHIPGVLNQVEGVPSDEEIKVAQNALRTAEGLVIHPQLFDADLSMKLSQHVFNLQFARYIHDSAQGGFASEKEAEEPRSVPQQPQEILNNPTVEEAGGPQREEGSDTGGLEGSVAGSEELEGSIPQVPRSSGLDRLGNVMNEMKNTMKESKSVLDNMNRMLTMIKRDQYMAYNTGKDSICYIFKDPLNGQCVAASEYALPHLHCTYNSWDGRYNVHLNPDEIARYLKFFNVGANLLQDSEEPKLVNGKQAEAETLLLTQAGIRK